MDNDDSDDQQSSGMPTKKQIISGIIEADLLCLQDPSIDVDVRQQCRKVRMRGWQPIVKIFKSGGKLDEPLDDITLKSNSRDPIRCAILYLYSLESFIYNVLNGVEFNRDINKGEDNSLDDVLSD